MYTNNEFQNKILGELQAGDSNNIDEIIFLLVIFAITRDNISEIDKQKLILFLFAFYNIKMEKKEIYYFINNKDEFIFYLKKKMNHVVN